MAGETSAMRGNRAAASRRVIARTTSLVFMCTISLVLLLLLDFSHINSGSFSGAFVSAAPGTPNANAAAATNAAASSAPITETELIAIDLGHENMKISAWRVQEEDVSIKAGGAGTVTTTTTAVSGAVSMVLNDQTNRKSPPCVAFRFFKSPINVEANKSTADEGGAHDVLYPPGYQLERTFAEQAQALAPRFPTQVICSPAQLLGYTLRDTTISAASAAPTASSESSPYQLSEDQLTAAYSFHVKSIQQQQQQQASGIAAGGVQQGKAAATDEARQALGVYVPFFATSATDAPHEGAFYSAEELTAMLLGYARQMTEKADAADNALSDDEERQLLELINTTNSDQPSLTAAQRDQQLQLMLRGHAVPRYAALTIPIHATVAQRQALMDAAALAGLRVVRLVHSTTGAAVQLAYLKGEQVFTADRPQFIMVYDMGSQQAEVAVYSFTAATARQKARAAYEGSVELRALVGSRTLGGAAFDECIAAQWDALYFNQTLLSGVGQARTELERRAAAKQRGSLLRAAHKAKETLSVNQEAHITLDGVHADTRLFSDVARQQQQRQHGLASAAVSVTPDGLLSLRYTRSEFEQTCQALFTAAVELRDAAIAATNGLVAHVGALDRFEVIGGGTRIPLFLQRLSDGYRGADNLVDRTLNSDEAAVLGTTLLSVATAPAALQLRGAGHAVPQYRVREWLTNPVYMSISADPSNMSELKEKEKDVQTTEGDDGEKAYLRLLFPAYKTIVPATRSVRVRLDLDEAARSTGAVDAAAMSITDSVTVSLFSGAEADKAYQRRAGALAAEAKSNPPSTEDTQGKNNNNNNQNAAVADAATNSLTGNLDLVVPVPATAARCASCYVHIYTVRGITNALAALQAQVKQQHANSQVALDSAELVVEAVITVSGIPHCSLAYVRAAYKITPNSVDVAGTSTSPVSTTRTASATLTPEASGDKTENPQRVGAEELGETAHDGDGVTDDEDVHNDNGEAPHAAQTADAPEANARAAADTVVVKLAPLTLTSVTTTRPIATTSRGRAEPHVALHGYNMGRAELLASHRRVRRLQAIDAARLRRSTLRNDIQTVLVWIKDQPAWDQNDVAPDTTATPTPEGTAAPALPPSWRDTVKEIGEWLDDFGETAGVEALETHLAAIRAIKMALRAAQGNA